MLLPRRVFARVPASTVLHQHKQQQQQQAPLTRLVSAAIYHQHRRTATLSASRTHFFPHNIVALQRLPTFALQKYSPVNPLNMSAVARQQTQTRSHAGHSHDHHHDTTFLTSTDKADAGVRITRIGLYVNLGMAITKSFGGYYFNSRALLADGLHSLTDLVSDVLTLATVSWSLKPPTTRFPNAYGKVESLGSLGVSGILLAGGFLMGYDALLALANLYVPGFAELTQALGLGHSGHSHGSPGEGLGPNINAAWLAAGSIAIKEWLYRATLKIARERKSNVLASNAYHHRVDSLTALVALFMIVGSNFMQSAAWMDPVGGLVISLMVIQAGWGNTRESILELADVGIDSEMRNKVRAATEVVLKNQPADVRVVGGVKAGQSFLMDVELGVPAEWSVAQTQQLERAVRDHIGSTVRGVKRLRVRFVSKDIGEPSLEDEFVDPALAPRGSPEPEEAHGHNHNHNHSHNHKH